MIGDLLPAIYMSILETNVGIICACMPAIQLLLRSVAPRIFGSSLQPAYGPHSKTYRTITNQAQPNYVITKTVTHTINAISKDTDSEIELVSVRNNRSAEGQSFTATVSTVEAAP